MEDKIILQTKDVKTYFYNDEGIVKAVDGVSFDIKEGETVGIVGESGCGKTITGLSIMRLIPGAGRIVSGEILFRLKGDNGSQMINLVEMDAEGKQMRYIRGGEIGLIFQEPMTAFSPVHTVGNQICENILLHSEVSKNEARQRAVDLLERVGIPRPGTIVDEYPYQLSGGMRQRSMVALALACNPNLLIADEPTTAVDVTIQAQMLQLMQELQREYKMSIMFITHDMGVIAEICSRVVVMYLGLAVEIGKTREVFHNPLHPYTRALLKSIPGLQSQPKTKLDTIKGSIPSPYAELQGCKFYDRCPDHKDICRSYGVPELKEEEEEHFVSCYLYN